VINICNKKVDVEIVEVSYDFEKTTKAIEENEMLPNDFANMLKKG
jgi:hypothetical protein